MFPHQVDNCIFSKRIEEEYRSISLVVLSRHYLCFIPSNELRNLQGRLSVENVVVCPMNSNILWKEKSKKERER